MTCGFIRLPTLQLVTKGRSALEWGVPYSGLAVKLNFRPYIGRYTSPNENFEYCYPLIIGCGYPAELTHRGSGMIWGSTCHQISSLWVTCVLFVLLILYNNFSTINNFSTMLGWFPVFLGWTSTKQRIKCLAHWHNTVTSVSLEPVTLRSQI